MTNDGMTNDGMTNDAMTNDAMTNDAMSRSRRTIHASPPLDIGHWALGIQPVIRHSSFVIRAASFPS